MKTLQSQQMIALLPCPLNVAETAAQKFEAVAPVLCRNKGFLHRATLEGWTNAEQVCVDGEASFVLWWHNSLDRGLWIDAAETMRETGNPGALVLAAEAIAKREGATYIRFMTVRPGLIKVAQNGGFKVEGVCLYKQL